MPQIAWVQRQHAGANPGGPPLIDLWLLCWSMASGVVRCFIDAIFGHSLGPGVVVVRCFIDAESRNVAQYSKRENVKTWEYP
jgi:hypothetical protein